MSFNSKLIIILSVFLLSIVTAYAVNFGAETIEVKNRITIDQLAQIQLVVYNYDVKPQNFIITTPDYPNWDVQTDPVSNPISVEVQPNSNATIDLFIKPNSKYVAQGSFFVNVAVESESSGDKITVQPRVAVVPEKDIPQGYVPTVTVQTNFPEKVDPTEQLKFTIILTNQNKLNITGAKLILSSKILNEEKMIDLGPEQEESIDVAVNLDPNLAPMEDKFQIRMLYKDKDLFSPVVKSYNIISFHDIKKSVEQKKIFFGNVKTYTFTNEGNAPYQDTLKIETNAFKRLFTSSDPEGRFKIEGGKSYFIWDSKIPAHGKAVLTIKENYISLFLLVIVVLLIVVALLMQKKTLAITKEIAEVDSEEGHLSRVKIVLNVKNTTNNPIENISVVDKVPNLLALDKDTVIGSLKPTKIVKNSKNDTLVLWDIPTLAAGEERVITYYLKSKLKIVGGFNLQPAMVKYHSGKKEVKVKSNLAVVKP